MSTDLDRLVTIPAGKGLELLRDGTITERLRGRIYAYTHEEPFLAAYRPVGAMPGSGGWEWRDLPGGIEARRAHTDRADACQAYAERVWRWYQGNSSSTSVPRPTRKQQQQGIGTKDCEAIIRLIEELIRERVAKLHAAFGELGL